MLPKLTRRNQKEPEGTLHSADIPHFIPLEVIRKIIAEVLVFVNYAFTPQTSKNHQQFINSVISKDKNPISQSQNFFIDKGQKSG